MQKVICRDITACEQDEKSTDRHYQIVRSFGSGFEISSRRTLPLKRMTLAAAQEHCRNPLSSFRQTLELVANQEKFKRLTSIEKSMVKQVLCYAKVHGEFSDGYVHVPVKRSKKGKGQ